MTRHQGFDVRISPQVLAALGSASGGAPRTRGARAFAEAMERLSREGTRAQGAKKLKGLDLWEMRFENRRAFFRLGPRSQMIAVGFALTKKSSRLPMRRLKHIERVVRAWSDELEASR